MVQLPRGGRRRKVLRIVNSSDCLLETAKSIGRHPTGTETLFRITRLALRNVNDFIFASLVIGVGI